MLNLRDKFNLAEEGFFKQFYEATKSLTALERGKALEENDAIEVAHEAAAASGESKQPSQLENVNLHFLALVNVEGNIYELDGRKAFPINHGTTSTETFLSDSVGIVKQFMARDPNNIHFTMCALAKTG